MVTNVDDRERAEPFGWVIGPTTWRGIVQRLARRYLPSPVIAIGGNDLYSVVVHGTGFSLPIADAAPVDGFYTTRIVTAPNARDAERRALLAVERDWRRRGHGSVALEIDSIYILEERFRLRSGSGAAFYRSSDDTGV